MVADATSVGIQSSFALSGWLVLTVAIPRLRYLGGSLYPDITAVEVDAAYINCYHALSKDIGRLLHPLAQIIEDLLPVVFSGDDLQKYMDKLPPSVSLAITVNPSSPPAPPVPPATRLLLNEIIACYEDLSLAIKRLELEWDGLRRILNLIHPLAFAYLLRLSAKGDSEFLHQVELVKKWATPGPEALCQELRERSNGLVNEGRKALQNHQELDAGTVGDTIGSGAKRDEATTVRRRYRSRRE